MSDSQAITVENISHHYASPDGTRVEALEDINFAVSTGEIISIVGASGCGKTTLLRILAGLLEPSSGVISTNSQSGTNRNSVGLIFQNYNDTLLHWKNVYENVKIGAKAKNKGPETIREITERCIDIVGLTEFQNALPKELSGGMKQRVQVGRILAYDPEILLCDEPFGALDKQTKEKLQQEFLEILANTPKTTIFVTHDIEEAIYLSDNVYVFTSKNPGRIDEKRRIGFSRPRFPKSDFMREHVDELLAEKEAIDAMMET